MLRSILGILMFAMIAVQGVSSQNVSTVQCGSILEGEFSRNAQRDEYNINLHAGDVLHVQGMPFGQML